MTRSFLPRVVRIFVAASERISTVSEIPIKSAGPGRIGQVSAKFLW